MQRDYEETWNIPRYNKQNYHFIYHLAEILFKNDYIKINK